MGPLTAFWPRIQSRLQEVRHTAPVTRQPASDPEQRRLAALRDGLQRLRSMPSAGDIARQVALNRIAVIKQRLEALKAMLRFASPEQAKALAVELRNLARELASVARSAGSSASGASAASGASSTDTGNSSEAGATVDAPADAPAASGGAAEAGEPAADTAGASDAGTVTPPAASPAMPAGDDGALRAALKEAQKLLKEVAHMLRAKLPRQNPHDRRLLDDIQHSIEQIDRVLNQNVDVAPLTAVMPTAGADAAAAATAAVPAGSIVDLHV